MFNIRLHFHDLVPGLLAMALHASASGGWGCSAIDCFEDFKVAKQVAGTHWNSDTDTNPELVYWKGSCATTTSLNITVYARVVNLATGSSTPFTFTGSLAPAGSVLDARKVASLPVGPLCVNN